MDLDDQELYVTKKAKGLLKKEKTPTQQVIDNVINYLNFECQETMSKEFDINSKYEKMNVLFNIKKYLDNYEDLEIILKDFFREKAQKDKWKEER